MPRYKVHHVDDPTDVVEITAASAGEAANVGARRMPDRLVRIAQPPPELENRTSDTSVGGVFVVDDGKSSTRYFVLGDLRSEQVQAFVVK